MKKLLIILAMAFGVSTAGHAKDVYSRNVSDLPQAAQVMLGKNFTAKISLIKIDKTMGMIDDYEVILTDGTEVEFDSKGNWKSVETPRNKSVPSSMIPANISQYVQKNYKGKKIIGLEKKRNKYEVELNNGLDLIFDLNGNFIKFD